MEHGAGRTVPVEQIQQEFAIRGVYLRYCDLIDAKEFDRLDEVFTVDCVRRYFDVDGAEEIRDPRPDGSAQEGLAPVIARLHRDLGPAVRTQHNVLNFRIAVDGKGARARVHFYAVHQRVGESGVLSLWGEYEDGLRLTPRGWRVHDRRYSTRVSHGEKGMVQPLLHPRRGG